MKKILLFLLIAATVSGQVIYKSKTTTKFAVIFDRTGTHQVDGSGIEYLEKCINGAKGYTPELFVMVGDCVEGGTGSASVMNTQWAEWDSIITGTNMTRPFRSVAGNHDNWFSGQESYFIRRFGAIYYTFIHKNIQFFMLDNNTWEPDSTNWLTDTEVTDSQLVWLSTQLQASTAKYKVVVAHKPWWDAYIDTLATSQLILNCAMHDTMTTYDVDLILTGHYHNYHGDSYDGIEMIIGGRSGGGSTLGHPDYSPNDADYTEPAAEPHKFLIIEIDDESGIQITLDSVS